jgi:hypothetical protein
MECQEHDFRILTTQPGHNIDILKHAIQSDLGHGFPLSYEQSSGFSGLSVSPQTLNNLKKV